MKRIISLLLVAVMFLGLCITPVTAENYFTDVSVSDWYFASVNRAYELGIMNGTSKDTFAPYEAVNRAMAVQVLYNMSGEKHEYSPYFNDVKENDWYAKAICWAKDKGIANGVSETRFDPDSPMTREQLACFIDRFITLYEIEVNNTAFAEYADMANVSDWANESVVKMYECGIMSPRIFDFFIPEASVNRAEFATFTLNMKGEEIEATDTDTHVQLVYTKVATATLTKGTSINIEGCVYPENATDNTIIYVSSDPSVASVDKSGNVTALAKGDVKITVTSRDGSFKAYSQISVSDDPKQLTPSVNVNYTSSLDVSGMTTIGRKIDPNKPMVALTYDDGPHRTYSTQILNTLEKYNAVATFFELGNRAVNCADILQREVQLGCEVANHSYDHPNLNTLSASGVASQISTTNNIIKNACSVTPKLVRPPYGNNNATVKANVNAPIILWSIDTLDWKYRDASYVSSVVKNQAYDGAIILMHSLYSSTAAATEIIVPWLISQGYQLVTVSEMAEARGIEMQNGMVYTSFNKKR